MNVLIIFVILLLQILFDANYYFQEFSVDDFFNAVRYGSRSHIDFILKGNKDLHHKLGNNVTPITSTY